MKNDKIIKEELLRIKTLMVYNTSLTSKENQETIQESNLMRYWLLPTGKLMAGNKIKGVIPTGAKSIGMFSSLSAAKNFLLGSTTAAAGAGTAAAGTAAAGTAAAGTAGAGTAAAGTAAAGTAGAGTAAVTGTFLGLGPVGWTILAVGGLAALGTWYFTKDTDTDKIKEIFDMCENNPESKKWKRFMSETDVKKIIRKLRKAMKGFGTDEKSVYDALSQFKSPGDFCAVSEKYKEYYNESLFEAIDDDFDYGWDEIANPLVKMIEEYAKKETEEFCKENPEECDKKLEEFCKKNPNEIKCKDIQKKVDDKSIDNKKSSGFTWIPSPTCDEVKSGNEEIKKGMKGACVSTIQKKLNDVNNAGLEIDDKFGGLTEGTVMEFQTKNQISPNGVVNKQTYQKLFVGVSDVKKPEGIEISSSGLSLESRKSKSILSRYSKK